MKLRSHSAEELQKHAVQLVARIEPRDRATVVTLSGELGAGKTTFVQGMGRALGVTEHMTSPTFVLEKIYDLRDQKWQRLLHLDAYRLESPNELKVLGWDKLLADAGNLVVLEWPERVADSIPEDATRIRFDIAGDGRIITINGEEKD